MKITGASLINRFYKRDGWTKEKVAELILPPHNSPMVVTVRNLGTTYQYYAVYVSSIVFDKAKVEQHEYKPFTSTERFKTNNQWR